MSIIPDIWELPPPDRRLEIAANQAAWTTADEHFRGWGAMSYAWVLPEMTAHGMVPNTPGAWQRIHGKPGSRRSARPLTDAQKQGLIRHTIHSPLMRYERYLGTAIAYENAKPALSCLDFARNRVADAVVQLAFPILGTDYATSTKPSECLPSSADGEVIEHFRGLAMLAELLSDAVDRVLSAAVEASSEHAPAMIAWRPIWNGRRLTGPIALKQVERVLRAKPTG